MQEKNEKYTNVSIDDRTARDITDIKIDIGIAKAEVISIKKAIETLEKTLVTKMEFAPIKLFVYGLAASCGAGVIGAILSKVLIK